MPKTLYLGEDEWSERNAKIRVVRDRDIRLDDKSTAGDVIDLLLDDAMDDFNVEIEDAEAVQ